MSILKFSEDESITDNCKMVFSYTFEATHKGISYNSKEGYKTDMVLRFLDLLKTNDSGEEINVIRADFDELNNRIIRISLVLFNGRKSKELIREAVIIKSNDNFLVAEI